MYLCYLNGRKLVGDQFVNKTGQILGRFSEFVANFYLIQSLEQLFHWMTRSYSTKVTQESSLAHVTMLSRAWVTCLATAGGMKVNLVESTDSNTDKISISIVKVTSFVQNII